MKLSRKKVDVHLSWEALRPSFESNEALKKAVTELVTNNLVPEATLEEVKVTEIKMTKEELKKYVDKMVKEGLKKMAKPPEAKDMNADQ